MYQSAFILWVAFCLLKQQTPSLDEVNGKKEEGKQDSGYLEVFREELT